MNEKLLVACLFINIIGIASASDVLGCGGFLKSHVPIDFSKVIVKLVTKQGIVKDQTNCAPNNGYYFIPLYDKGEYTLQLDPPPGWSFDPTKINIVVDGKTDVCSQGQDINFVFFGFGITGKVESLGSTDGPAGVEVKLITDSEVRSTKTAENGLFFFTPVYPGLHTVTASHPKWKFSRNSIAVTVTEGNTELPAKSLVIAGYDVSGIVQSDGQPIKGVLMLLHSEKKTNLPVEGCVKAPPENVKMQDNYLCYVVSNDQGIYEFPTLPKGTYYVLPFYRGQNIHFQPDSISFTVDHASSKINTPFEVVGFSVFGRVLTHDSGIPLPGASIYIDNVEVGKSGNDGTYSLEKIKAGVYTITAKAENYQFEPKTVKVNPGVSQLPDIYPTLYKVCGTVISQQSQIIKITKIGSTQHFSVDSDPSSGEFCQYLKPGKYQLQVLIGDVEKQQRIQFFPLTQTIEVSSKPVLKIVFSQLKATVSGTVECHKPKDCTFLKAILRPIINDVSREENDIIADIKGDRYSFTEVRPGQYEVLLTQNRLCWKQNKHVITISSTTHTVKPFVQRGYSIILTSTHDAKLTYKVNQDLKTLVIQQGRTQECLDSPGKYTFNLISCHIYASNTIEYDTESDNNEVMITALKHKHDIGIQAAKDFGNITVKVSIDGEKTLSDPLPYKNGQYTLKLYLNPQESAILIPQSDILYFNPPISVIKGTDDCADLKDSFEAVKGRVFKGRVTPPLAGVQITVSSDNSETLMNETDADGFYQFRPLDDSKSYVVTAVKNSCVLVGPDDAGNFLAHKLAEIVVEVIDEASNQPLQGALLSLSGDQSYRSNLQTNEDGKITFHSLSPSEYFLRPMMKEYSFEPSSKIIDVKEGATISVQLKGKRVAYSAYGTITSLNGDPEDKVIVIAAGVGNCSHFSEETTSESNGQFRIRGLLPYCTYNLEVSGSLNVNEHFERAVPASILLEKISKDTKNLKLIVFRQPQHMDILVKVFTENPEHYRSLRVKVTRESQPSGSVSQTKIEQSGYKVTKDYNYGVMLHLPSVPLDGKQYSVHLETTLSHYNKYKPPIEYFMANNSFKYVELKFVLKASTIDQHIKQTSVWTLALIFMVMVAVYNIEKILRWVNENFAGVNLDAFSNLKFRPKKEDYSNDNKDIDQIVQSINATKKKPKPKKI